MVPNKTPLPGVRKGQDKKILGITFRIPSAG